MSTDASPPTAGDHDRMVRKYLVRNFLAHALEGGIYVGGLTFLAGGIVMPKIVESLGGSGWLIAAMPLMLMAGFQLPTLLTAHLIERLHRLRPLLLAMGVIQRLPYLLTAGVLYFWADDFPTFTLIAVVLCPFASGFFGGLSMTAWSELLANTIPVERRSSLWATRNIIAALIGLAAGGGVLAILRLRPGPSGYSLLHLITFGLLMVSYAIFWLIREVPNPRARATHTMGVLESLRQMPALVGADRRFRRYLLSTMFAAGINIMIPFLSIHALAVLGKPEAYLGALVTVSMVGAIAGNLIAGFLGDRYGGKCVMMTALAGMVALCIWAMLARTAAEFWMVFSLLGAASFCYHVGRMTLNLEVCPLERRVRYLAITAAAGLVGTVSAWAICATTNALSEGLFGAVATLAVISLLISGAFLLKVEEPRAKRQANTAGD